MLRSPTYAALGVGIQCGNRNGEALRLDTNCGNRNGEALRLDTNCGNRNGEALRLDIHCGNRNGEALPLDIHCGNRNGEAVGVPSNCGNRNGEAVGVPSRPVQCAAFTGDADGPAGTPGGTDRSGRSHPSPRPCDPRRAVILPEHLRGIPGLRASTREAILARQPKTVREMIAIPFVGRPTARRLFEKGLITDPGPDRALPGLPER